MIENVLWHSHVLWRICLLCHIVCYRDECIWKQKTMVKEPALLDGRDSMMVPSGAV